MKAARTPWKPAPSVSVVLASQNAKVAGAGADLVSVTASPTRHCVSTGCPFYKRGCYAQLGNEGVHDARRNAASLAAGNTPEDDARHEAAGIDRLPAAGQPMRLHSAGDCATPEAARIVAAAVERWKVRGGGPVWTYTHAWRPGARDPVARADWGSVPALASVETVELAAQARLRGWVPAITLPFLAFPGRTWTDRLGGRWLACPAQVDPSMTCARCGACAREDALRRSGYGIAFLAHGSNAGVVRETVRILQRAHGMGATCEGSHGLPESPVGV